MQRRTRNRYPGIIRATPWSLVHPAELVVPGNFLHVYVLGRLRVDTVRQESKPAIHRYRFFFPLFLHVNLDLASKKRMTIPRVEGGIRRLLLACPSRC